MPDLAAPTRLSLNSEDSVTQLGCRIAEHLKPGDAILLNGPIGAGKTHLARAIIRALMGHDEEVPSPTYTLVQTYETEETTIWHADLYRLGDSSELIELGLDEAIGDGIVLVEWSDRIPEELRPTDALEITITPIGNTRRLQFNASSQHWAGFLKELADD